MTVKGLGIGLQVWGLGLRVRVTRLGIRFAWKLMGSSNGAIVLLVIHK